MSLQENGFGVSGEQRRARQDELLTTLADGVQALTTSDGWRRYLRAMAALRTYSLSNQLLILRGGSVATSGNCERDWSRGTGHPRHPRRAVGHHRRRQ